MRRAPIILDVRAEIRAGRPPLGLVLSTAAGLGPGDRLVVKVPFKPAPLIQMLTDQGFTHKAKPLMEGDWELTFTRADAPAATGEKSTPVVRMDARGLEPPQLMTKILEALATLPPGAELWAHTDRLPLLEEQGCTATAEEQPDGSHLTRITRR